ncbi:(Fe-S)-binding protein [Reinekea marinisedimentorum]|uniref:Fe-S oxidoreductase n=1 Tax=Reinekea marinisedimentorum TaxID=230495 RepID=A0A4R3I9U9_9GAMM|nr:(Fe-S)-binding protein [Reinekea marinisedimentorum]TCS42658.1 Fe-S oxidoreductase [Reinekea marinisedimentorum]
MKHQLDWSDYHDQGMGDAYADIPKHGGNFAKAISVCIRSGLCQKQDNRGVMCPSYRISEDNLLSPGGRVQLFKSLLNEDDKSFLNDKLLAQSIDSCVSCKGCKRECESNLDMAAIKAEYLAQKRAAGHITIRSRLFAEFPFLLYRYPVLASLIRMRNNSRVLMKLGALLFGVNGSIALPEPAKNPYQDSREQKILNDEYQMNSDNTRTVVLLIDSFTALFTPSVVNDALTVLKAGGYQVITLHPKSLSDGKILDSGRSLFSQGYSDRARSQAAALLRTLKPHLLAGRRIVGLEPSALLMLRDEFLMMNLGDDAELLAKNTLLIEEFIARETTAGRFDASFNAAESGRNVLIHGHCHQKAVGAMKSMRKVLRLVPGLPFSFIEASCCGMAGSFGLEAEHASESVAMADQGLLPALDEDQAALVVCNGFSCSHQIFALRERKAVHVVSLLASQLAAA